MIRPSVIRPYVIQTGFLIAGTASGVGKTTVTLAILAALRRRGLTAQPFKGGPDFLDTTHQTRIAGRPARNLDTWLLTPETNRDLFASATDHVDAAIVEGMMGLFDGKDGASETGSSAEIARLLGLPIVLVLDASKSARSIAATVLGFELFDPTLPLAGIVLNRVASPRHLAMLRQAIETRCQTPVLGSLPRTPEIAISERHLGLHAAPASDPEAEITQLASLAETHLDLPRLLTLQPAPQSRVPQVSHLRPGFANQQIVRIGIAEDQAFFFYYQDNLELLRQHGADLIPFSPIADSTLPPNLDALYLGGGYPELHAETLSRNTSMLAAIRAFAHTGAPIYAECGGMIYLASSLRTAESTYPLTALLPLEVEMTPRLVDFGYTTITFTRPCLLGPAGTVIRGHSFHYSRLAQPPTCETAYEITYSLSNRTQPEGYTQGNILGSYIHLHFAANPAVAQNFLASIVRHRSQTLAAV